MICVAVCVAFMLLPASSDARRQRPELVVTSLGGLPATVAPGAGFELRDKVRNKGRKAKRTVNAYFLSENRVREPLDMKLEGSRKVPRLKRGESSEATVELEVPRPTTRGEYLLLACADARHKVRERRESNNCAASEDRIVVTAGGTGDREPPPPPRITATDPLSPANNNSPRVFGEAEAGARVRIFSGDCSGNSLVAGSAAAFNGVGGITVPVRDDRTTELRATATDEAGNTSDCSARFAYEEDSTAPGPPTILGPTSPSADETPTVLGGAAAGTTVRLYAGGCAGAPLATGSAVDFGLTGFTVTVAENATTDFHATATDPAGNVSACSAALPYIEDSVAPDPPTISGTVPAQPAADTSIAVLGVAEAGSAVIIYGAAAGDPGCVGGTALTLGTAADFGAGGLPATVPEDMTTDLYASAIDVAGNVSGCSSPAFPYQDLPAP